MLRLNDLRYAIAGRYLFDGASATIPAGHKVGLVGRNGTGKTTLFNLIYGHLTLESGEIGVPKGARIGGVSQEVPGSDTSLLDTVLEADTERSALMAQADIETDPNRIADLQTRLADIDAWSAEARASSILRGLGFDAAAQSEPCANFSGGWRMRVALAGVLFARPDLLLLDEPTNYLDLEGAIWLETYLARYPHTVIVISHDRGLLNRAVGSILHLEDKKLTYYTVPYDKFAEQRATKLAQAEALNVKNQARIAHLQSFVDRFRYKASKAVQAQSRLKMIERIQLISTPQEAALKAFSFPKPEELSPPIVALEGAAVGYGDVTVLNKLTLRIDQDDRIALLGKNGEGKSTLSKLLSSKLKAQAGRITSASKLRIGYFAQHQVDELVIEDTALDHIRRLRPDHLPGKLRAMLAGFGLTADQVEVPVGQLSGGQKARLSLCLATLDAPHLLILDEPTNHLDIESREALVEALNAYTGAVVLVSHDMHLLNLVADRLWLVKGGRVSPYDGDLESYRNLLLSREKPASAERPKLHKPSREKLLELRAEVRKCETRIEKLDEMRDTLASRLVNPALYEDDQIATMEVYQRKYAEVMEAMDRAERLWVSAQDALDKAEQALSA